MDDDIDSMFDDKDTVPTEAVTEPTVGAPQEVQPEPTEPEVPQEQPQAPQEPVVPEEPTEPQKPLTADEVRNILSDMREQERNSGKALDEAESEVMKAYYPQGLSNVLVDETTGKELRSPQDVVDASGGEMTIEQATQWLMNEQYKLDKQITDIKQSARELAETNYNFKQGATRVIDKYKPIFDKYPQLQQKVFNNYMKTVKIDNEKDLVLSAPDIEDYYADVMEPYVMAFGYQAPPAQQPTGKIPESRQTAADRMDISGDVGSSDTGDADPNDADASLSKLFGE